jgi:hypothetical protein
MIQVEPRRKKGQVHKSRTSDEIHTKPARIERNLKVSSAKVREIEVGQFN